MGRVTLLLGLRTVIYHAPDLGASKAWFAGVLGVEPYFDEPFYVGFDVGGYELGLVPAADGFELLAVMADPDGFTYTRRKNGDVVIHHRGRVASVLRGRAAADFLEDAIAGDDQELMARLTGNYKHGNERDAANHPRNHP